MKVQYNILAKQFKESLINKCFSLGYCLATRPREEHFLFMWRNIIWYLGYMVSDTWEVKSLNYRREGYEKVLQPWINSNWYPYVNLYRNGKPKSEVIHRLVATAFIENLEGKSDVNHKNWIKTDNSLENLEWMTRSENICHAYKKWLNYASENNCFRRNNPRKWKYLDNALNARKVVQSQKDGTFVKTWWCILNASKHLWIDNSSISKCALWKRKTAWWFKWYYLATMESTCWEAKEASFWLEDVKWVQEY